MICSLTFAQKPTSYLEVSTNNSEQTINNTLATIVRAENSQREIVGTYTTLIDFNEAVAANCSNTTLISEDFANGPAGILVCGTSVSDAGDGCFAAGELQAGFTVGASNDETSSPTDVVYIPAGAIGNVDPLVGAAAFTDYTIINFSPDVYAVAMDIWENNDPTTSIGLFRPGDTVIDVISVNTPINSQTFFGIVTDEPIAKIIIAGRLGSGELFGNFLYGGDCTLSVDDNLQELISIYPNPIDDTLFLNIPSSITIKDVKIYDILGKSIPVNMVNNQINVSTLNSGMYFVKINALQGTLTKKLVKK